MFDELDDLPLAEADRRIRERLDEIRAQMSGLGRYRASRIAAEVERRGRGGVASVAEELGIKPVAVYRVLSEAKKHRS